ncbi:MAG TPA: creatininase family protein [Solirubrobacteraceae bacterium]|nr:creatininase family protein [Solirubrobacteraceae bacterium]
MIACVNAAELTWPAFRERLRAGAPLILTVGSIEQHGPHLPLATDTIIVEYLARELGEHVGGVLLPTLPFGAPSRPRSGGGDGFPVPALTLRALLDSVEAIANGAVRAGARTLVVLSWHMENAAVLWDALRGPLERAADCRALLFEAPWDYLDDELTQALFPEGQAQSLWPADHAGRLETAVMRHLAPELVGEPPEPVAFRPRHGYDVLPTPADAVPQTGVVLDARAVDAELGERCLRAMVEGLAAAVTAEL